MKITILTIFPEMFQDFLHTSIVARAIANGLVSVQIRDIREFATGSYRHVDDSPIGGGAGMILKCQPVLDCLEAVRTPQSHVVLTAAAGTTWTQEKAHAFAELEDLILICGHYEGLDERIASHVDEQISIGDYVLTGGELPAMVISDSVIRLLKGSIKAESAAEESYENTLLEYPQYTQPADYKGDKVPEILLSGDHEKIRRWRLMQSLKRTRDQRPDLLARHVFTDEEKALLKTLEEQEASARLLSVFRKRLNVRELGGIETANGRHVRYGCFYRGSAPARFTQDELQAYQQMRLKAVFDFRMQEEQQAFPDPDLPGVMRYSTPAVQEQHQENAPEPMPLEELVKHQENSYAQMQTFFQSFYRQLIFHNEAYAAVFQAMLKGQVPMYLHCTTGKDRTGICCLLILLLLGCSRQTAEADYLTTNAYLQDFIEERLQKDHPDGRISEETRQTYELLLGVKKETVDMVLNAIEAAYPSYEQYFEQEYQISAAQRRKLRKMYLED